MAAKQQDMSKMMNEMMASMPFDMSAMQNSFKSYATFGEKMSKVALEAAEKSTDLSSKWTRETLSKVGDATQSRQDPSDYTKAMTDFASSQAEMNAETMAAFAEVAKRMQMESTELMMAAGKDVSEDMTAAAEKASKDMSDNAEKASKELSASAKKATAAAK